MMKTVIDVKKERTSFQNRVKQAGMVFHCVVQKRANLANVAHIVPFPKCLADFAIDSWHAF